ncbi:Tetratricopeptide repeat protein 21A, partial [Tetrabaena socialis]
YVNNPREALKELNLARKDSRWGSSAILHMVEIYLNPDNDAVWEEKENADTPESREAVATARSLLKQVRGADTSSQRYRVLECYAIMAGKDKNEIENALNTLLDMANQ